MLEELRAWLNGNREYYAGVILYAKAGDNEALKQLFAKGKTDYCTERLQAELLRICQQLKAQQHENDSTNSRRAATDLPTDGISETSRREDLHYNRLSGKPPTAAGQPLASSSGTSGQTPVNGTLHAVCKKEADAVYKEVMNLRAELFALARADDFSDPNTPDRIEQRSKLAVKVAEGFKRVSQLYERADYVRIHGRLPADGEPDGEELEPDGLPEHLVKQTLDNLRKNVNKMRKREQTPERMALLQKHEANLKKLEARWRLLQPAK